MQNKIRIFYIEGAGEKILARKALYRIERKIFSHQHNNSNYYKYIRIGVIKKKIKESIIDTSSFVNRSFRSSVDFLSCILIGLRKQKDLRTVDVYV
jgi:hypothetical protein